MGDLAAYDGEHHPAHKLLLDPANYARIETDLVWLGVTGLQDPPRPEVAAAMESCRQAGVRVSPSLPVDWLEVALECKPQAATTKAHSGVADKLRKVQLADGTI